MDTWLMNCSNGRSEAGHRSQEVYFSHDWSSTVKQASCPWSRLNGSLKHGTGGAARCPAVMMSSIGALCGSQACHSFSPPPGVCCWSHPFTEAIAKTLLVETLAQTVESPPPIQTRLWYSYSEEFCLWLLSVLSLPSNTLTQHTFILPHTLWSTHTPWKIPGPFTSSARYTSRLPLTCFYKVKHSQEEGKNTWSS